MVGPSQYNTKGFLWGTNRDTYTVDATSLLFTSFLSSRCTHRKIFVSFWDSTPAPLILVWAPYFWDNLSHFLSHFFFSMSWKFLSKWESLHLQLTLFALFFWISFLSFRDVSSFTLNHLHSCLETFLISVWDILVSIWDYPCLISGLPYLTMKFLYLVFSFWLSHCELSPVSFWFQPSLIWRFLEFRFDSCCVSFWDHGCLSPSLRFLPPRRPTHTQQEQRFKVRSCPL